MVASEASTEEIETAVSDFFEASEVAEEEEVTSEVAVPVEQESAALEEEAEV